MKMVRNHFGRLSALALAAALVAPELAAQSTMPSTMRYGSGLVDVPVSSVLPHLAITGTYSGFFLSLDRTVTIDDAAVLTGFGPGVDEFYQDASVAIGLFDRVELGTTIQSLGDAADGGNIWGVFGQIQLVKPTDAGIGLAVGGRYVTAPDYGNNVANQPTRLGFADPRFRESYTGISDDVNTELTLYGVASAHLRGFDAGFLPKHDLTISLGYGSGMFRDGDALSFYRFADADGWFMGSALHFGVGDNAVLSFMGEYNGFDVNLGAQLDISGVRLGAQYLAANYQEPAGGWYSQYRKPKFGILASVAVCPEDGGLCKPKLIDRPSLEVVQLPAPPPDTVRITREVERALPDGTPASVCLATGENVQVRVTAQGDTLVGPSRASIRTLRPGVVFAGSYAQGAAWFQNDAPITFENRRYDKSGNEVRLDCAQIMRVGEHMGVPLFAMRNADRPFQMIYVPVRPGVWQSYQSGLRRTRGD